MFIFYTVGIFNLFGQVYFIKQLVLFSIYFNKFSKAYGQLLIKLTRIAY